MYAGFAHQRYDVASLPFIPFSDTGGEALSSTGAVAGGMLNSDGSVSLAQWFKGGLTDLGALPGIPSPDFDRPRVFGMNGCGTIVGTVHTSAGNLPSRAFLWDHGSFKVLPLMDPAHLGGAAIGVNGLGDVVGYDHTSGNRTTAWLWSNGTYTSLPVSGTSTVAFGINSGGTIIGNHASGLLRRLLTGRFRHSGQRGYVLSRGKARHLNGFVYAINNLGEAAGGSTSGGKAMAAVFRNSLATVILKQRSAAVGINSVADVVGFYHPAGSDLRRLFIWSATSGAFDLTPDGFRSAQAAAINDHGQVLGFGETVGGERPYFLLTPDPTGVLRPKALEIATPEPCRSRA
jgi:probable HAF family extracellular repeat protein